MKRRDFTVGALLTLPFLSIIRNLSGSPSPSAIQPFVVRSDQSRFNVATPFRGINPNHLKISTRDTGGAFSFFDYQGTSQIEGPDLHLHLQQDELFYVMNGEFLFQLGDQKIVGTKGDAIFGPRNIQHTWTQLSKSGRLLYFAVPAGHLEDFFVRVSNMKTPPTPDEALALDKEFAMKHVGKSLSFQENHQYAASLNDGFLLKKEISRYWDMDKIVSTSPVSLKLSKRDTDGAMTVLDYEGNGKGGPPLHIHPEQDESFFVLEGSYIFQAGNKKFTLSEGDTIFLPRNIPHTWAQRSDKGRLLFMFNPSGMMEEFFAIYNATTTSPSPEEAARLFATHGMKVLGPPIDLS